jgi:hypothetical protein
MLGQAVCHRHRGVPAHLRSDPRPAHRRATWPVPGEIFILALTILGVLALIVWLAIRLPV